MLKSGRKFPGGRKESGALANGSKQYTNKKVWSAVARVYGTILPRKKNVRVQLRYTAAASVLCFPVGGCAWM